MYGSHRMESDWERLEVAQVRVDIMGLCGPLPVIVSSSSEELECFHGRFCVSRLNARPTGLIEYWLT